MPTVRSQRRRRPADALPYRLAVHSESIRQGLGIQVFINRPGSTYDNPAAVKALLADLGCGMVRTRIVTDTPSVDWMRSLHTDHGIGWNAVMGALTTGAAEWDQYEAYVRQTPEVFRGLECYNEPNAFDRPPNWLTDTIAHQARIKPLADDVGIPAVGPSLHDQVATLAQDYVDLAPLAADVDIIGIHRYPAGSSPSHLMGDRTDLAVNAWGAKPFRCTEGGYFTAPNYTGGANPVTQAQQAAYAPRHSMEWVWYGLQQTGVPYEFCQFELPGDVDPAGANREAHLGLVDTPSTDPATWINKPAYATVRALWDGLRDEGPTYTPAPLPCTVSGPADLRTVLTGKRDGTYRLYAWRDVDVDTSGDAPAQSIVVRDASGQRTIPVAGELITIGVT